MFLKSHPKLFQQGLILVSLPLAFELIFVFFLVQMLNDAERQANFAEQSRAIINESTMVAVLTYDCINSLTCYNNTDEKKWAERFNAKQSEIPAHLNMLDKLVQDRPSRVQDIAKKFQTEAHRQSRLLEKVKERIDDGDKLFAAAVAQKFQGDNNDIARMAVDLELLGREVDTQKITEEEQSSRKRIRSFLYAFVLVNVILAFALVFYFNRATIKRLQVLVDNTRKLAKKEPLNPVLAGEDEMAVLDKGFHATAKSLEELDRRKQEFVSMISHDLRTPLTSILGTIALLERGIFGSLNENGNKRVRDSELSIRQLIKLINDLLDIDKLESGRFELFIQNLEFSELIERSIDTVRSFAEQNEITIVSQVSSLKLDCDADRMQQVLVNLLSNAVKFSPAGSTVLIEARIKSDDWVEIAVKDQGRGIPKEKIDAVFDRFKQVEEADGRKKGGTGLGLAICKAILEEHGGSIGVESEPGKGSIFFLRLKSKAIKCSAAS